MNESSSLIGFVAPEPSDLAPLFPGYEIHDLIATGGMGAVYCAMQKSLDRTVALKILPMEFSDDLAFCQGFEAEAKAMARLNHPNLIGVYDFGEVNGMLYIVMEFVPGKSLYHSANASLIDPGEASRLVTGICNGLAHAHENGILHRDIKPSNILLTPQAEPKIGDFGLARPVERRMHKDEQIFGTPGYTAPEVVNAPETVDHRADLFSVGVLLHELLTGKLPADDPRPASVISGCDVRFDAIIRRATQPLPASRYFSAKEIAAELLTITTARATGPIATVPGVAKAGVRRPPQPMRAMPATVKSKSLSLKWIGPLLAIIIMAFSWHTFANMKPRIVVVDPPAATPHSTGSSGRGFETVVSPTGSQTTPLQQQAPTPPAVTEAHETESPVAARPPVAEAGQPGKGVNHKGFGREHSMGMNSSPTKPAAKPRETPAGVPKGAIPFRGKKYFVYKGNFTWHAARDLCTAQHGQLAVIPDEATQEFVKKQAGGKNLWIGGSNEKVKGRWDWVDGSAMKYKHFNPDEPNNREGENYLAVTGKNSGWVDSVDSGDGLMRGYICEWPDTP